MPCRRDEDLRRPGVRLLRLCELEGDDGLLLGEVPDPHTRREVAVNGLDAELVIPICEDEPILTGELDRLLLAECRLIAADLLVVDVLSDNHVVALDVGDSVLLGEAARLLAEIFVLSRDSRGRVRPLEGEAAVGCAALAVAGRDDEIVDRIEAQGVELFRSDRDGELLALGGIVDGAENLVVQLFDDRDFVAVKTSPESESLTVYSIVKSWFLSPRLRSLSEIRGSVFRISRTGRKPKYAVREDEEVQL